MVRRPSTRFQEAVFFTFCGSSFSSSSEPPTQQLSLNLLWWFQEDSKVVPHPGKIFPYQMFQISWWKHRGEESKNIYIA